MKQHDLIRHLLSHGCRLRREGAGHSFYENPVIHKASAVPRHSEINTFTARKICKDLQIPPPKQR
jgi:predicted RNA binding protein YcfA (HicA-like mRNA interferase family)